MSTEVLYMEDRRGQEPDPCYLREFDANVREPGPDFVILDRTAFYAEGGGQPYDTGVLSWPGGAARVLRVTKEKGVIRHHVDRLPPGESVRGKIDWDRRYAHMRYHTSQHLMSGLVWKIFGARTVGNQLYTDHARVDFQPVNFTLEDLARIEAECNRAIEAAHEVRIFQEDRVVVDSKIGDRSLLDLIPASIRRLRVIQVGTADYCPCGGTHLKNTLEIGRVHMLEKRSKGKETDRIVYEILPSGNQPAGPR
jgi:misacylated tRNA(Ala) deacylase